MLDINDAWSHGQVESKLWLCRTLEDLQYMRSLPAASPVMWVLGGWVGLFPFLLLSRDRFQVANIRSFDLDPTATMQANSVCNAWVVGGKFLALDGDANELDYAELPDIVINTSAEHMASRKWYEEICDGTPVAIQTNDLPHPDHVFQHRSVDELLQDFPMSAVLFSGELKLDYPDKSYRRFMAIGRK